MEKRIDLILHGARGGEENMALDRALLRDAEGGRAAIRVYGWDRPMVSLGKRMRSEEVAEIFPELPTVHRPSGGGAVLHGFDVTIALAMPLPMIGVKPRELRETYRRLIAPIVQALADSGLPCSLAEDRASDSSIDCFAGAGRMDLLHDERGTKVAGCALVATRSAALLQASIPAYGLPASLPIDDDTVARYTNPIWSSGRFFDVLSSEWRRRGYVAELAGLDASLPIGVRAHTVYGQDLDLPVFRFEMTRAIQDLIVNRVPKASTREERLRLLQECPEWEDWLPTRETILARIEGF